MINSVSESRRDEPQSTAKFGAVNRRIALGFVGLAVLSFCYLRDDFDPGSIRNKRVLVTGASSGIGEQVAYQYARLGARLVLTARRVELLNAVERRCRHLGAPFVASVPADMSAVADRARVVRETERLLGGLDHLILNHAYVDAALWTGSPANLTALRHYLEVNFFSFVDVASLALRMLSESAGGMGVVGSTSSKLGVQRLAPYTATKHALQGFFSSWRRELALRHPNVSVTFCILGLVDTEHAMSLLERYYVSRAFMFIPSAEDAAGAVLKSVALKSREPIFNWAASVMVYVHKIIPGYLEDFISSF